MSTDKNKIPTKIIFLLLAQALLLAGSMPHEPLLENNRYLKNSLYIQAEALRVPMMGDASRYRFRDATGSINGTEKLPKSKKSKVIINIIQEAPRLIEEGKAIEIIPMLEILNVILELRGLPDTKGRYANQSVSYMEKSYFIEMFQRVASNERAKAFIKDLGLEEFYETYFTKAPPSSDYNLSKDDLPFNWDLISPTDQALAEDLLISAYQRAGVGEIIKIVQSNTEDGIDINGGNLQTELLAKRMIALGNQAIDELIKTDDSNPEVFRRIIWLLGRSKDSFAASILLQKLRFFKGVDAEQGKVILFDKETLFAADWLAASQIIYALAENGDARVADGVISALKYEIAANRHVRKAIIESLGQLLDQAALPELVPLINKKDELSLSAAMACVNIIKNMKPQDKEKSSHVKNVVDAISLLLNNPPIVNRFPMARMLWEIDTQESKAALFKFLATGQNADQLLTEIVDNVLYGSLYYSLAIGIDMLEFVGRLDMIPDVYFEDQTTKVSFREWQYLRDIRGLSRENILKHLTDPSLIAVRLSNNSFTIINSKDTKAASLALRPIVREYFGSLLSSGGRISALMLTRVFRLSRTWEGVMQLLLEEMSDSGRILFLENNHDGTYFIRNKARESQYLGRYL
ncbi:MAG: HEAT repeat domain-containing protein [Candidatus Omnitrophota bacterium]|nr:HEAT repeat domain-containing protein [Candidatus Omnitrophota bacterium]